MNVLHLDSVDGQWANKKNRTGPICAFSSAKQIAPILEEKH